MDSDIIIISASEKRAASIDITLEGASIDKKFETDFYWAQGGADGRFGSHFQIETKFTVGTGAPYMVI